MMKYPWAQNRSKLERAIGALGTEASEEAIKARYIEMAGFVLTDVGELPAQKEEGESSDDDSEDKPKKSKKK